MTETQQLVMEGAALLEGAKLAREEHRRRKRDDRMEELATTVQRINDYQHRIKPLIHQATYRPVPQEKELRELSDQLQRERRKLRKMLSRTVGTAGLEGGWS